MKRTASTATFAALSCLALAPPLAAQPAPGAVSPAGTQATSPKPADKCLSDVSAFSSQMSKDGYWSGGHGYGYGYGYGYPIGGYGYGMVGGAPAGEFAGYGSARPGYEIRTLAASATILGQLGQEQPCQAVLAAASDVHKRSVADLRSRSASGYDQPGWQRRQIAAALPITGKDSAFRSDQLIDSDVVNPANETLGSVHDLVTDPKTGKVAYVIVSRGGLFGIDASYVPVPWADFRLTPDASLLVLDSTKAVMTAAPQVSDSQFTKAGQFDPESKKVEAYWAPRVKAASTAN